MSESKASATEIYHLAACINTHSWNGDKTQVALCPNNNEIRIYKKDNNQFKLEHELTEHEGLVTGIDWAPKSNQIVSCSQDRHVYVWHYERYKWKKAAWAYPWFTRGCVQCKWNPKEDRFVVTTAEKIVHVCYEENAFCLARRIRGHSIALDAAWHPNGFILATAGNDARCRIVSGFLTFYDKKGEINTASFGAKLPSGTIVNEIEARGWIRCVKWSPSGTYHDCTLTVVDVSSRPHQVQSLRYNRLPLLDLLWINERSIIGVGYDCTPLLFQRRDEDWYVWLTAKVNTNTMYRVYVMSLDEHLQVHESEETTEVDATEHDLNRELRTSHQNCITCIQAVTSTEDVVTSFSTSGLDGQLIIWHLDVLESILGIKF